MLSHLSLYLRVQIIVLWEDGRTVYKIVATLELKGEELCVLLSGERIVTFQSEMLAHSVKEVTLSSSIAILSIV